LPRLIGQNLRKDDDGGKAFDMTANGGRQTDLGLPQPIFSPFIRAMQNIESVIRAC